MHDEQMQFVATVKAVFPEFFRDVSVIEIGSYDVNGSIRPLFDTDDYIGLDLVTGPGVDLVCAGHLYSSKRRFDVAVSAECFEHNPFWRETFQNMAEHARPGGLVIVTCASEGRAEHGTSRADAASSPGTVQTGSDYYRNLTAADLAEIDLAGLFSDWRFCVNAASCDLYFIGVRRGHAQVRGVSERLDWLAGLCAANERTAIALHDAMDLLAAGDIDAGLDAAQAARSNASPACVEQADRVLGWALRLAGRLDESEAALRRGLLLSPTPDGFFHLALTLRRLGRADEAIEAAREAATRRPGVAAYGDLLSLLQDT